MAYGDIRCWVEQMPIGALFDLDDVQAAFPVKSRPAIKSALGRLCQGDEPLVARAVRGTYCRRQLGLRTRASLPLEAMELLPWRIAGPGAGFSGPDVINKIGWSTQVSPRPWIAVVGRPPSPQGTGAVFVGRSNRKRLSLSVWEVSLLEAVRCFDTWSEMKWDDALKRFEDYMARGYFAKPARSDVLVEVARAERGIGPVFVPRCRELFAVAGKAPQPEQCDA